MINAGFDSSKIFKVYNSLNYDLQKIFENNQEYNLKRELNFFKTPNLKTILFLGRLTSVKKIDLLIKS